MNQIFNDEPDISLKDQLFPEVEVSAEEAVMELNKQKKKHSKFKLNKHLNNSYPDDLIRSSIIKQRLLNKLNKINL